MAAARITVHDADHMFPYAYTRGVKDRLVWWLADEADRLSDVGKSEAAHEVDCLAYRLHQS